MASIEKRPRKGGTTYRITVYLGERNEHGQAIRHRIIYKPEPSLTEHQADKEAKAVAERFEEELKHGLRTDSNITVREWIEHVILSKELAGRKKKTISSYRRVAVRINQSIGAMRLREVKTDDLNKVLRWLSEETTSSSARAIVRSDVNLSEILDLELLSKTHLAQMAGISKSTVTSALNGEKILAVNAAKIAETLRYRAEELFDFPKENHHLSAKTLQDYKTFLSLVFSAAEREGIISYNPVKMLEQSTYELKEVHVLQPNEVQRIWEAAEKEPVNKRCLLHLFLITGCRRGEIAGLRWSRVLWNEQAIKIDNTIQYTPENGSYEDTTKTRQVRVIRLPKETMELLHEYQIWQQQYSLEKGAVWVDSDYIFTRVNGGFISPETISGYIRRFQKKYGLPQIHPHLFRHTMASILYYSGSDPVSISKRLGHAQVSTTQNIYSHLIQQADIDSAEHIANAIFRGGKPNASL